MKRAVLALAMLGLLSLPLVPVLSQPAAPDPVAALEGGTAIPDGSYDIDFTNLGKSSVSFISDAEEQIIGTVVFGANQNQVGKVSVDNAKGTGTANFTLQVADMRTGNNMRDEHMRSANWLDAEKFPTIQIKDAKLTRKKPTVWELSGTFVFHGVEKPIAVLANVRYFENFPPGLKKVARVKGEFSVDITQHGINNATVGSPAMAKVWKVQFALFGFVKEPPKDNK